MGFASKLNMNLLSKGEADAAGAQDAADTQASGSASAAARRLGRLRKEPDAPEGGADLRANPFGTQFQPNRQRVLLGAFAAGVLATLLGMWQNAASDARSAGQSQVAGDAVMHSQRVGKAAPNALRGDAPAFAQLEESRAELGRELDLLARGGQSPTGRIPAASGERADKLSQAIATWNASSKAAGTIIGFKSNLLAFGVSLRQFEEVAPELMGIADRLQKEGIAGGAESRREVAALSMMSLTQRLSAGTQTFTTPGSAQNAVVTILGDIESLNEIIDGLLNGSAKLGLAPLTDLEQRMRLTRVREGFQQYANTVTPLLGNLTSYARARAAERVIWRDNEALRVMLADLHRGYQADQRETSGWLWLAIGAAVFTLLAALGISRSMLQDSRERARSADERRREAEAMRQLAQSKEEQAKATNDQNQAAILRLMNELQEVADGDLTVQATVSEDITGAIADSVNYTVEELRELVVRVIRTSEQVARASGGAQQVSTELLGAAEQQSREIEDASTTTLRLAGLITEVSRSASESADVARQSVAAAEQGAHAVQNAIRGMQEIREQIQETSKRIKRLGESSQEIGEITELISDITEQTNVLALNAAIQAASAGEAGRGFSVVAEEVQRLAERSGDAAKQIGALVRTIQTDTHDAVAAMEKSTQGVVEGARLSDAAGAALADISRVSNRLGELIHDMSTATERQATKAGGVAQKMQQILAVTEHTQQGTRQTARSIHELATLAQELKDSVSRFRVVS
ncbi:methyl-accepting chemotaxis protein [Massilia sp. YIM B02443]|uniref:methyl-accepting chemotaxis protein n=1 Tax=Massilia sp. YIM B02443 TaxID=3050127 RepID=UPI0025B6F945|nr:methyl-accepting chemotaxis protein [Massilia sp. YIM B02443]